MSNLPLHDVNLNIETLNIFRPIETFLPYNLPKLEKIKTDQQPKPATLAPVTPKPAATKAKVDDTYCKACKKKFNNAGSFTNHLKSAKHIAAEKKLGNSSKPAAQANATKAPEKVAVDPKVQDALSQLEQAKSSTDPNVAISIYSSQSQVLFGLQRPQHVETALKSLIEALDRPGLSLTPAQIQSFRYSSQLALSRLLCLYQELDASRAMYLNALESEWKINTTKLLELAKQIRTTPIASLLASCDTLAKEYLTRARSQTEQVLTSSEPNNTFTLILNEAASLFAQEQQTYGQVPCEHVAIVLYGICSLVCPFEKQHGTPQDFYFLMSQVYTLLPNLTHRVIELKLLDKENTWNLFDALLLCLEIDDVVLAKTIQQQIVKQDQPDIDFLCNVLKKRITLTEDVNLLQDLEYIRLLFNESMTDALFMGNQPRQTQELTLARLEQLVMIS